MASEIDPFFFPFILGLTAAGPSQETPDPTGPRGRVVLIDLLTQTMAVVEANAGAVFGDLFPGKTGPKPASKSAIESLPRVEIGTAQIDGEEEPCAVCLEELKCGDLAKEMPCRHRFHGGCLEKWLRINGCCPVCRHELPAGGEDDDVEGKSRGERGEREIWVRFSFGGLRNRENQGDSLGQQENLD
ncbi:RING/U-box superfamily protein [Striga asiatica]|uniref:RING-type E3 ubiquitin transferase n=1 Tax=Striga asiatica TaxID=4170 RepID=A0A5A7QH02_STRAF|nr:RING/U-box superfamily protein [Striga asiatica]